MPKRLEEEKNNCDSQKINKPKIIGNTSAFQKMEIVNKNGSDTNSKKSGLNYMSQTRPLTPEPVFKFMASEYNYINSEIKKENINIWEYNPIIFKSNILEPKFNYSKSKYLESSEDYGKELDPKNFIKNPNLGNNINTCINCKLGNGTFCNEFFFGLNLISQTFNPKVIENNSNIIGQSLKNVNVNNNSNPNSFKFSLINSFIDKKSKSKNKIKLNKEFKNRRTKKENLIFNIPHDFLISFDIKEIIIKDLELNQDKEIYCIENAKNFLNYICNNRENINNNLNLNGEYSEYIEFKEISNENIKKENENYILNVSNDQYVNEYMRKKRKRRGKKEIKKKKSGRITKLENYV